jgi:predicted  nucleic acid-binding Zn-ribbon protein
MIKPTVPGTKNTFWRMRLCSNVVILPLKIGSRHKGKAMTMREPEVQFLNALNELQSTFEKQYQTWQASYHALQHELEQSKARETALRAKNDMLLRKLSTANTLPEQHSLVRQIKMLSAHLDTLAKDATAFNHHLNNQQKNSDNFSGDNP